MDNNPKSHYAKAFEKAQHSKGEKFDVPRFFSRIFPRSKLGLVLDRILAHMKKEFKLFKYDKFNFFISIILPPFVVFLLSYQALNALPSPDLTVAIVSNDNQAWMIEVGVGSEGGGGEGEEEACVGLCANYTLPFVNAINQSESLVLHSWYNSTEDLESLVSARALLEQGMINAILVLPSNFSEDIIEGRPVIIGLLLTATDIKYVQTQLNQVQTALSFFKSELNLTPEVQFVMEQHYSINNDNLVQRNFNDIMANYIPFILFGFCTILTILVVVDDKPIGRLLLTPIGKVELLTSKYLTYSIIILIQVALVMGISQWMGVLNISTFGNLFWTLFLIGFSSMSIGILISTMAKTSNEADQFFYGLFIVSVLLSGLLVGLDTMPSFIQFIANFLPLAHQMELLRAVIHKGLPFNFTLEAVQWLLLVNLLTIIASFIIFLRRKFDV